MPETSQRWKVERSQLGPVNKRCGLLNVSYPVAAPKK